MIRCTSPSFKATVGASVGALALLLAGCSTPSTSAATTETSSVPALAQAVNEFASVQPHPAAADLLPKSVADSGELKIVMNVSSAPTKFYAEDNKAIIGLNPDLARLLSRTLGLEPNISDVQFDGIIPALQTGRYDVAVSSMAITPERTKVLDMIDYASWGSSLAVPSGNPAKLTVDNLCEKKIAVQQGSIQHATRVPELATRTCGDAAGIEMVVLPSQQDALTQLSSGRVDGIIADTPVMAYAATKTKGRFDLVDEINASPVAIATAKDSELTPALEAAMKHVLSLPEYKASFATWGMNTSLITETKVNQ